MSHLLDSMREFIQATGASRYRIAQESGVSESQLSRLMSGERGISVESLEKLADYLGLRITIEPNRQIRKGR